MREYWSILWEASQEKSIGTIELSYYSAIAILNKNDKTRSRCYYVAESGITDTFNESRMMPRTWLVFEATVKPRYKHPVDKHT